MNRNGIPTACIACNRKAGTDRLYREYAEAARVFKKVLKHMVVRQGASLREFVINENALLLDGVDLQKWAPTAEELKGKS